MRIPELLERARASLTTGQPDRARKTLRDVLERDPSNASAHDLLGQVLLALGEVAPAIAAYDTAVRLDASSGGFRQHLAAALVAADRNEEALAALDEAQRLDPAATDVQLDHSRVLASLGRASEASAAFERLLAGAPELAAAKLGLGDLQLANGDAKAAAGAARDVLDADPVSAPALDLLTRSYAAAPPDDAIDDLMGRVRKLVDRNRVREAAKAYKTIARLFPDATVAASQAVFVSNYFNEAEPLATMQRARDFAFGLPRRVQPPDWRRRDRNPERRIKIGFVSGDLRHHVVTRFLIGYVHLLDQARVELVAYSTSTIADTFTDKLKVSFSTWHRVDAMSDAELAALIEADGIDILVDLGGHSPTGRPALFALKPAPIQVTWLGYSGTTGIPEIDYILADGFVAPAGSDAEFSEAAWRLPDAYLCYTPPVPEVPLGPLPALANRTITFGSCNLLAKVSDATVALWARLLTKLPRSRLVLKSAALSYPDVVAETTARFARHGIGADRLTLIGFIEGHTSHYSAYNRIDIALDPFPYNGTTTTAEALWMGVPVLTLRGDRFIARVGESMLTAAGLSNWVAADADDFVAKAVAFASDVPALAKLRAGLRKQFLASPLCDGPRFAHSLEEAFRGMWRIWCEKQRLGG